MTEGRTKKYIASESGRSEAAKDADESMLTEDNFDAKSADDAWQLVEMAIRVNNID